MMNQLTRSAFILLVTLLPSLGYAAGISVSVDRNQVTTEDQIQLVVEVEGGRSEPELPEFPSFEVYNRGRSSQTNIINGKMSSSVSYNFILVPSQTGKFQIGAASVDIDGKLYQSRPFILTVLDPSQKPKEQAAAFIETTVSTETPYVGGQIVYTWRLYRRVRLTGADVTFPEFEGVVIEELGEQRDYNATIGGQQYEVSEVKRALFPAKAGKLTIPSSQINIEMVVENSRQQRGRGRGSVFDGFFSRGQTKRKTLRSKPIELVVQELPPAPANFSGLVGEFQANAKMSKTQLRVGESATLTIVISGSGNWKSIAEPEFGNLSAFKTYSDKSTNHPSKNKNNFAGRKVFKQALVPLQPGPQTIEPYVFTYFSLQHGEYRNARTRRFNLSVAPATEAENLQLTENRAPGMGKVAVKVLADDILPLKKSLAQVTPQTKPLTYAMKMSLGLGFPAFAFFGFAWLQRRREEEASDTGLKRKRMAMTQARSDMKAIAESENPLAAGSRVLRHFLGNQLNLEGGALTSSDVHDTLVDKGVDADLAKRVRKFLSVCEMAQFAAPSTEEQSSQKVADTVEQLLKDLQQAIGGQR
ncbi:MAG: protein BatD [Deltaproteobacteria bacterium]|nr:protein BatD [Deltaproteobacteria bacterium]